MNPEGPPLRTAGAARRVLESLTILAFLAAIVAPMVDLCVRPDSARSPQSHEFRTPAPEPASPESMQALLLYPERYEAYFKDSFGLRDQLLRWNSIVKVFGFGVSPSPDAAIGKQDWIFYTGGHSHENHRGAYPFTQTELERWGRVLEHNRALLESLGVAYLFVVAPDKQTIYPELLSDSMRPIGPTRLSQLLDYTKVHEPRVEILDLSGALIAAKSGDTPGDWMYESLGTHWNGRGSQVALRTMLTRLDGMIGGLAPSEVDSFERLELAGDSDTWSTRMYIGDLLEQKSSAMLPKTVHAKANVEGELMFGRVRTSEIADSTRPRVILMHDSFGPYLELGLSEQCSYLECRWELSLDAAHITAVKPNAFVHLYVERTLNTLPPHALLLTEDSAWSGRFFDSKKVLVTVDKTRPDWGILPIGGAKLGPAMEFPKPRLEVALKSPADRLAFPALTPVSGELPVLHLVIDSPAATELVLFYKSPQAESFSRESSYRRTLEAGSNEFFLPLDHEGTAGELRLKPGAPIYQYLLREFEIRSVPAH